MERALGASDGATPTQAVFPALRAMETRLAVLDDAAFTEMARRVKRLMLLDDDGPQSAVARKSLLSPAAAGGLVRGEMSPPELRRMLDIMERWDSVSAELPAIVARLQVRYFFVGLFSPHPADV